MGMRRSRICHVAARGPLPGAPILTRVGGNPTKQEVRKTPPMMLDWPTFVLQRRINRPLGAVEQVLCDPHVLRSGSELDLGSDGMYAQLDGPFGVTFPPFGLDGASWWAPVSAH